MDNSSHKETVVELLRTREDSDILAHRESATLEFKENFNFSGVAEYYRDFAGFANNKGGYLIFGVKDKPRKRIGLSEKGKDHFDRLDPQAVTGHLLEDFSGQIDWLHDVIELGGMTFGFFYVAPAKDKPIICKKTEGKTLIEAEIYYRYNGRTQRIRYSELEAIINDRIGSQNKQMMEMMVKIFKSGPQNAAILDLEKRTLETNEAQVLVVDEKLVEKIKFIKEGQFDEKEGAPALKLIGDVASVNKVEVVKHEEVDPLREYPLSAKELAAKVKEQGGVKINDVWRLIAKHKIRENKQYAYYNFRCKKQADEYLLHGRVPNGVPLIYKPEAVDYIIQLAQCGK